MLPVDSPFRQSNGRRGGVATEVVKAQQRTADDSVAEHDALHSKYGRIRRGVQGVEHPLVRVHAAQRVDAKGEIEDRRVTRQARTAAQQIRQGEVVGPHERQPVLES